MTDDTKIEMEGLSAVMRQFPDTAEMTLDEIAEKAGPVAYSLRLPFTYAFALESVKVEGLSRHALMRRLIEDGIRRMLQTRVIPASEGDPEIQLCQEQV